MTVIALLLASALTTGSAASEQPATVAQTTVRDTIPAKVSVAFYLRNNLGWWRNFSLVTYPPKRRVPAITVRTLFPFQRIRIRVPIGAELYIASEEEIKFLREGGDLRQVRPPRIEAASALEGRVFDIF